MEIEKNLRICELFTNLNSNILSFFLHLHSDFLEKILLRLIKNLIKLLFIEFHKALYYLGSYLNQW